MASHFLCCLCFCRRLCSSFLTYTKFGRLFYMTGENREAARLTGIPVDRYRTIAYMISGLFAALGGIVLASRIGTGQVSAGASLLMDGVAAAFIGFSVFGAGKPNVIGTLLGSILIGVLLNGLTMMNVPYYAQDIIKGTILIFALALSHIVKSNPPYARWVSNVRSFSTFSISSSIRRITSVDACSSSCSCASAPFISPFAYASAAFSPRRAHVHEGHQAFHTLACLSVVFRLFIKVPFS